MAKDNRRAASIMGKLTYYRFVFCRIFFITFIILLMLTLASGLSRTSGETWLVP